MAWQGWENFVPNGSQPEQAGKKGSKYRNKPYVLDGIRFDSQREAQRWYELQQMQKAGLISELARQVNFDLTTMRRGDEARGFQSVGKYRADFTYIAQGKLVVEDAKGMRTDIYRWKKKHFEIEYGIPIKEV